MDKGRWTTAPVIEAAPTIVKPADREGISVRLRTMDVSLGYFDGDDTKYAVDKVSVDVPERGFVGVMGPSGSGKSSLLYLLSGLKRPTQGAIELDGRPYSTLGEKQLTQVRR